VREQTAGPHYRYTDEQLTLVIKVGNFEFVPGHIRVPRGKEILLNVENISGTGHNFTIKDPGGKILQKVALPPNERVSVELRLGESGEYPFIATNLSTPHWE